jgi:thioredoxin 1
MKIVTSADFETEVLKSDKPVLVDLFATWCGPCKMIAPLLEKVAAEEAGRLKVVKVDVDASPEIAAKYFVRSVPTLLMIKNGEVVSSKLGAASKKDLLKWIDEALALPAGTKVDLAPKQVSLSDADKQRLRDVFNEAVNKSPDADTPTTLLTADGSETTLRKQYTEALDNGEIFQEMEATLNEGYTLDEIIDDLRTTELSIPKPVSLSDSEKQSLRDLFNEAVNKSPDADVPTTILTADGSVTTLRKSIEKELKDGSLFKTVEAVLAQTKMPLNVYIDAVRRQGLALPKPPKA